MSFAGRLFNDPVRSNLPPSFALPKSHSTTPGHWPIGVPTTTSPSLTPLSYVPETEWDTRQHMFQTRGREDFAACTHFRPDPSFTNCSDFILAFGGVKEQGKPWIGVALPDDLNISAHLRDANKVGSAVRKKRQRHTTVKVRYDDNLRRTYDVHASLKTARAGVDIVHFIDLSCTTERVQSQREF
ncbi:hypothetical protein V8C34DRAFT_282175 [Trichoderma compactum]